MQRSEWKKNSSSDPSDLWFAILILFCTMLALSSIGCVSSRRSAPEPMWRPSIYQVKNVNGRCVLRRAFNSDTVNCDDPQVYKMACVPIEELETLNEKLNRCGVWK